MRPADLRDYWRLRRLCFNPGEALRFRKGGAPGEVLELRLRAGGTLAIRGATQDYNVFRDVYLYDEYALDSLPAPLGCVVDLGANAGYFAARAAGCAERVVAYEPVPENAALARRNTAPFGHVEVVEAAVGARTGEQRLHLARAARGTGLHSIHRDGAVHSDEAITVPCVSLADLFERHGIERCDLLKLDVEGAEYEILFGAPPDVLSSVGRIAAEYHAGGGEPGFTPDALASHLEACGFAVTRRPSSHHPHTGLLFARRAGA